MFECSVVIVYGEGPAERLTVDEADRIATRMFHSHNHTATHPQPAVYWVRSKDDYRA